jgi:hypothetical protein
MRIVECAKIQQKTFSPARKKWPASHPADAAFYFAAAPEQ